MEPVRDFILLGSKITADGGCSHEIKRCFLLGRKAMTKLDSKLDSRDITLPTEVHLVKAIIFPIILYGCESWTIKKAEHQRIDAFKLWYWRRPLSVPWTARRSNQSILKEISPEYSLEGLMLKLQYFGYWWVELTHWKKPWCWERVKAGGEGNNRRWDGWMGSPTWWTWVWASSRSWWQIGKPWCAAVHGVTKSWTWLSTWSELNSNSEHLYMSLFATSMSSLEKCLFRSSSHFSIGWSLFPLLSFMSCVYILEIIPSLVASSTNIFPHSIGCVEAAHPKSSWRSLRNSFQSHSFP